MYKILVTSLFRVDIKKLDKSVAKKIILKIEDIVKKPELLRFYLKYMPRDLAHLQKYRIGDWRVLFWVDHNKKIVTLYGLEHRSKLYKRFK